MRWGFFFFFPSSLAFAQSSYYWPRPQQISGVGEGGVNGGVCTGRAVSPLLAPPGGGDPTLTPGPAAAPGRESPKGQEERDLNPGKDPAGQARRGGVAPALLPRAPLAKTIGVPETRIGPHPYSLGHLPSSAGCPAGLARARDGAAAGSAGNGLR